MEKLQGRLAEVRRTAGQWLAHLNGDLAYARYCEHWRQAHDGPPPDRAEFFRADLKRRWSGVRRCC